MDKSDYQLMLHVIDNLDIFVSDDGSVEMAEHMEDEYGIPDFHRRVEELRLKIAPLI